VQVTRMVLRREYQSLEPIRFPIEPLSSEEDPDDVSESGTPDVGGDIVERREVDETLVDPQGMEGSEVKAVTPLDPGDMRWLEEDSSPGEEVLGLEQLFAIVQN
jgi:hypothetical protein